MRNTIASKSSVALALTLLLASCSSRLEMTQRQFESIVTVGLKGQSAKISVDGKKVRGSLARHTETIVDGAEAFFERGGCLHPDARSEREHDCEVRPDADRIVIYIHGGMVSRGKAFDSATSPPAPFPRSESA